LTTQGVHISTSNANNVKCDGDSGKCLFLMKADQNNNPQWSTVISGVPANDVVPWGLEIDPSGDKPHIFISGATDFTGATTTNVKFYHARYKVNDAGGPFTTFITLTNRANGAFPGVAGAGDTGNPNTPLAPIKCRGFLAKYQGDGTALWATPICGSADNAAGHKFSMLLSVYRPSTSLIINTEGTSDNPSDSPIKGYLRDNGGVFAAGTVTVTANTESVNFGVESAKFAYGANTATTFLEKYQQAVLGPTAASELQWGYVVKYDTDGLVLWARKIVGPAADTVVITSVTAMAIKCMCQDIRGPIKWTKLILAHLKPAWEKELHLIMITQIISCVRLCTRRQSPHSAYSSLRMMHLVWSVGSRHLQKVQL